jgi:hypothetical protein
MNASTTTRLPALLLALALSACGGGGGGDVDATTLAKAKAMAQPQTALVDSALCNAVTLADGSYSLDGDGRCQRAARLLATAPRAQQLQASHPATGTLDADALFDWAEQNFAALFPGHKTSLTVAPYVLRYYPETQMYLGVANGTVYALGPITGGALVALGKLVDFNCTVFPGNCAVPDAPSIGTATAGDASAVVSFTAPAFTGGSAISSYTVSCLGGSGINPLTTASGATSPITVSGLTNGSSYTCWATASNSFGSSGKSTAVLVTPKAGSGTGTGTGTGTSSVDPSKLTLGDGHFTTTTPAVGSLYVCTTGGHGGASSKGPWFNADGTTWNSLTKISVQGAVSWTSSFLVQLGSTLGITGNGLPPHTTGTFPIASSDPAYAYDRNPNRIQTSSIAWGLPANPTVAARPSCTAGGAIGVLLTGARLFNADDGGSRDAVAWEIQDSCQGHPEQTGQYHYHSVSSCISQKDTAGQHSPLVGYIADGFGLYGNLGENGKALTNADLDECHGHTHAIQLNGATVTQYHYHQTKEFPYTVGCYKGTPVTIH